MKSGMPKLRKEGNSFLFVLFCVSNYKVSGMAMWVSGLVDKVRWRRRHLGERRSRNGEARLSLRSSIWILK